MNKKIIKQMYADIVAKDKYRPTLIGIHFQEDHCVATDTHMLVVYNEGSKNLVGKTITVEGEEITRTDEKGNKLPVKYPDYNRVIPTLNEENVVDLNLTQLLAALKYHKRTKDAHKDDRIAFGENIFCIDFIARILNLIQMAGELSICKFYLNESGRPALWVSPSFTSLLMPIGGDQIDVDGERLPDSAVVLSYETVINNYAFNGWRKEEKSGDLDWLD